MYNVKYLLVIHQHLYLISTCLYFKAVFFSVLMSRFLILNIYVYMQVRQNKKRFHLQRLSSND